VRKKDLSWQYEDVGVPHPGKRWLLSLTSLPSGETRVREQAAEIPFFRSLLAELWLNMRRDYDLQVAESAKLAPIG
jgi:hypothetical protein